MANINTHNDNQAGYSVKSYTLGFILSIIFTIIPFGVVNEKLFTNLTTIIVVFGCAIVQLFIQLVFFMHLNTESKPRYNSGFLLFTLLSLLILVIGTIWIMSSLAYKMHPVMHHMMH